MSALLDPVGPEPTSTYWRRRLLVLVGLIAVIVILVTGVKALTNLSSEGAEGEGQEPKPGASEQPADNTPPPSQLCEAGVIEVAAGVDSRNFPAGQKPTFTMSITNSGAVDCLVENVQSTFAVEVVSGSDRIWNSLDCPAVDGPNQSFLIAAGGTQNVEVPWERVRSDETCRTDWPALRAGTYKVQVIYGDISSEQLSFQLAD